MRPTSSLVPSCCCTWWPTSWAITYAHAKSPLGLRAGAPCRGRRRGRGRRSGRPGSRTGRRPSWPRRTPCRRRRGRGRAWRARSRWPCSANVRCQVVLDVVEDVDREVLEVGVGVLAGAGSARRLGARVARVEAGGDVEARRRCRRRGAGSRGRGSRRRRRARRRRQRRAAAAAVRRRRGRRSRPSSMPRASTSCRAAYPAAARALRRGAVGPLPWPWRPRGGFGCSAGGTSAALRGVARGCGRRGRFAAAGVGGAASSPRGFFGRGLRAPARLLFGRRLRGVFVAAAFFAAGFLAAAFRAAGFFAAAFVAAGFFAAAFAAGFCGRLRRGRLLRGRLVAAGSRFATGFGARLRRRRASSPRPSPCAAGFAARLGFASGAASTAGAALAAAGFGARLRAGRFAARRLRRAACGRPASAGPPRSITTRRGRSARRRSRRPRPPRRPRAAATAGRPARPACGARGAGRASAPRRRPAPSAARLAAARARLARGRRVLAVGLVDLDAVRIVVQHAVVEQRAVQRRLRRHALGHALLLAPPRAAPALALGEVAQQLARERRRLARHPRARAVDDLARLGGVRDRRREQRGAQPPVLLARRVHEPARVARVRAAARVHEQAEQPLRLRPALHGVLLVHLARHVRAAPDPVVGLVAPADLLLGERLEHDLDALALVVARPGLDEVERAVERLGVARRGDLLQRAQPQLRRSCCGRRR